MDKTIKLKEKNRLKLSRPNLTKNKRKNENNMQWTPKLSEELLDHEPNLKTVMTPLPLKYSLKNSNSRVLEKACLEVDRQLLIKKVVIQVRNNKALVEAENQCLKRYKFNNKNKMWRNLVREILIKIKIWK